MIAGETARWKQALSNKNKECNFGVLKEFDAAKRPCNYADVELLKERRRTLYYQIQEAKSPISRAKPLWGTGVSYYISAKFISASESHYYETVTLPAQRAAFLQKAEEEHYHPESPHFGRK